MVELGDQPRAAQMYEEALTLTEELLGADHPAYIRRLIGHAAGLRSRGKLHEALDAINEAERRLRAEGEAARHELPPLLESKAAILMDRKEVADCVRILEEALAIRRTILGEQHPDVARDLNQLAEALMARGDSAAALESWEQALRILEHRGEPELDRPLRARLVENLARAHLRRSDPEQALRFLRQALDLHKRQLIANVAGLGDRERLVLVGGLRGPFFQTLELLRGSPERDREMYHYLLMWKGVATAGRQQAMKALKRGSDAHDVQVKAALDADRTHRRVLASAFYARSRDALSEGDRTFAQRNARMPGPLTVRRRAPHREDLAADRMGVRLELRSRTDSLLSQRAGVTQRHHSPLLEHVAAALPERSAFVNVLNSLLSQFGDQGQQQRPPTLEQVAGALPERSVFVNVLKYPAGAAGARYVAFVVRRDGAPVRVELGTAEPIDKAILSWRTAVLNGGDFESPGRELYRRIWATLSPLCQGASTIFVSPDGGAQPVAAGGLAGPRSVSGAGSLPDRAVDSLQRRFGATVRRARREGFCIVLGTARRRWDRL